MYGRDMGHLSVLLGSKEYLTVSGDQGDLWHRAMIDIDTINSTDRVSKGFNFNIFVIYKNHTLITLIGTVLSIHVHELNLFYVQYRVSC